MLVRCADSARQPTSILGEKCPLRDPGARDINGLTTLSVDVHGLWRYGHDADVDVRPAWDRGRLLRGGEFIMQGNLAGARTSIPARLRAVTRGNEQCVALVEGDEEVIYGELAERVDAMARALAAVPGVIRGGADASRVLLLFQRKLPAVVAMLACARAGLAYVCADAGDPDERLRFIADDSAPSIVVADAMLCARAAALVPAGVRVVDAGSVPAAAGPLPDVDPDTLLFLYYTSGSTGRPKAARQTHAHIVAYSDTYAAATGARAADRMSLISTLSFAASFTETYGALLQGATLCAYDTRGEGVRDLADWLDRERLAIVHFVPTVFREMCKRIPPQRVLPWLRTVVLAGEAAYGRDLVQFRAHTNRDARLVHMLASTEACAVSFATFDRASDYAPHAALPVGRCPPAVDVRIERADGTPAAVDEPGAIVIESGYVSPGYWRRPDLDAACFGASRTPGWRSYRPGDYASVDADGVLHFTGREQGRVKIRGHSVHLAEVEAAVCAQADVREAGVATRPQVEGGGDDIVAFVVAESPFDEREFRGALARTLPSYMLPARMVAVDSLPRTPSGKLDRAALAQLPVPAHAVAGDDAPRDDVERAIAAVFARLLRKRDLGRHADFFMLGGDSLLTAELQADLDDLFGTQVESILADATVAGVAAAVRRAAAARGPRARRFPPLIPLWKSGTRTPMFIVHGRDGQAFVSPRFMRLLGDDQPLWAFQARGLEEGAEPYATLEAMAADYVVELRRVQPRGPYCLLAMCAGGYVAALMAQALVAAGDVVLPLLLFDPPRQLEAGYTAQLTELEFGTFVRRRAAELAAAGPQRSPGFLRRAYRVAVAFDEALLAHRPRTYAGPVMLLSSRARSKAARPEEFARHFAGPVVEHVVGEGHHDAINSSNATFVDAFAHCLAELRRVEFACAASHAGI